MAGRKKKEAHTEEIPVFATVEKEPVEKEPVEDDTAVPEEYTNFVDEKETVPTGSPILNLSLTNNYKAGFRLGKVVRFLGGSGSGKSAIAMDILAEVTLSKTLKNYKTYYYDKEDGLQINLARRYPNIKPGTIQYFSPDECPQSMEGMFQEIRTRCEQGSCVIVVDSLDCLITDKQYATAENNDKLRESGKDAKEDGMAVAARVMSSEWKRTIPVISKSNSLLILISQLRESLNMYQKDKAFNTSGGNALKFFESVRIEVKAGDHLKRIDKYNNEQTQRTLGHSRQKC